MRQPNKYVNTTVCTDFLFWCNFLSFTVMGGQSCKYLTHPGVQLVKFYSGLSTCKENIVHQVKVKKMITSVRSEVLNQVDTNLHHWFR